MHELTLPEHLVQSEPPMKRETGKFEAWLVVLFCVALGLSVWSSVKKYYVEEDYVVEVPLACDTSKEVCSITDCSDEEGCPESGTRPTKLVRILASDLHPCLATRCESECASGKVRCEPVPCEENCSEIQAPEAQADTATSTEKTASTTEQTP